MKISVLARTLGVLVLAAASVGTALQFTSCGGTNSQSTSATNAPAPKALTPEEVSAYLENPEKLFFLDVREEEEIKELGSIAGYVHIPIGQLESRLNEIPKDKLIITA